MDRFQPLLSAIGRLDVKTLGLKTPDYLREVQYHRVRDAWWDCAPSHHPASDAGESGGRKTKGKNRGG